MNARGFDGLFERHWRKNRGNALGQHGLAGAGRTDEEDVVASGAGYFERALGGLLAVDVAEVHGIWRGFGEQCCASTVTGVKDSGELTRSTACGRDFSAKTFTPSTTAASLALASGTATAFTPYSRAASAADRAPRTGRTLPSKENSPRNIILSSCLPKNCPWQPTRPRRHRKIESRAFFADVGGSQIDGDTLAVRKFVAAIAKSAFDALAAFLYGVVRQAHNVEVLHARGTDVHLYFDEVGVDAIDRGAERLEEHIKEAPERASQG